MTREERQLLLKDLSARLPYEPWVWFKENWETNPNFKGYQSQLRLYHLEYIVKDMDITLKPYLRPMSSMTDEEIKELKHLIAFSGSPDGAANLVDWLNKKMFAYRTIDGKDMFKLGLALEAPEGMYKEE